MEFFQVMNALMMKEIFSLRSSIMRRNAQLFDWFIQNHSSPSVINMNQVSIPVNTAPNPRPGTDYPTPTCIMFYRLPFFIPPTHSSPFQMLYFHLGPVWIPKFSPWTKLSFGLKAIKGLVERPWYAWSAASGRANAGLLSCAGRRACSVLCPCVRRLEHCHSIMTSTNYKLHGPLDRNSQKLHLRPIKQTIRYPILKLIHGLILVAMMGISSFSLRRRSFSQ